MKNKRENLAESNASEPNNLPIPSTSFTLTSIFSSYALVIILLIGIFSYSNTFYSPFVFDDICRIVDYEKLHLDSISIDSLTPLISDTRPVAQLSFALNHYFGGLNTFGYHLVNLLIHLLTAVFIYQFLKLTLNLPSLQDRYGKQAQEIALLSSLLFVAHPIQIQAVTYIIQRMTSLAAMFYMLALLAYAKGRITKGQKGIFLYIASALSALLAFASKEHTATLPLIIILYEFFFFQELDFKNGKKKLGRLSLLIVPPLAVWLCTLDFKWILASYRKYPFTMTERVFTEFRVVIYYISLLLFPLPSRLNLDHDFSVSHSLFAPPTTIISLLIIIGLIVVAVRIARRQPVVSFSIFWFLVTLIPESSIIPLELIYEHRLYLPSVGFFLPLGILLVKGIEKIKLQTPVKAQIKMVFLLALVMSLSTITYQRNKLWQDSVTLWEDAIKKSPYKARPHYNLGEVYVSRREFDKAISCYLKAIELRPIYPEAYNNLGFCYFFKGDLPKAIAATQTALKFDDKNCSAHYSLGIYYRDTGEIALAINEFKLAIKIEPAYSGAILALEELQTGPSHAPGVENTLDAKELKAAKGEKLL